MYSNNNQNSRFFAFFISQAKKQIIILIVVSVLLNTFFFCFSNFSPDFIFQKDLKSFVDYMSSTFLDNNDGWKHAQFYMYWIIQSIFLVISFVTTFFSFDVLIYFICIDKRKQLIFQKHSEIINSCPLKNFNDKVALVIGICNDFLPNTLLQTANQTYKNLDVWICDDSSNPDVIKEVDEFAKQHKNVYVCRRDSEHKKLHKSKIGNTFYWLNKYGSKYDYIFENDSSTIVTNTFVENCLCYFHSNLLADEKIAGIVCNGSFYWTDNFISKINSYDWQIANEILSRIALEIGSRTPLDGWCCFYKTSTISQIPLEDVECAACDAARGLWLNKHGYTSVLNPFDFGAKIGVQNVQAFKNQRIKWVGAEYFMIKSNLTFNKKINLLWKTQVFTWVYLPFSILFILSFLSLMLILSLNVFYLNWTIVLVATILSVITFFVTWIYCACKKYKFFKILWILFWIGILEAGILYKRVWQFCIRGFVMNTPSTLTCITKKTPYASTIKEKIRMGVFDFSILLISLGICLTLTFTIGGWSINNDPTIVANFENTYINNWCVWFMLFPFLSFPSFCYILMIWIGEIKVKKCYDHNSTYFPVEKYDFRYRWVKESEIWKQQHKDR